MGKVYTVPWGIPFVKILALGLASRSQQDPLGAAETLVFLPTRRGILSLKEYLLSLKRPLILPRFYALADLEKNPILPGFYAMDSKEERPFLSPRQRTSQLRQLIERFLEIHPSFLSQGSGKVSLSEQYALAEELSQLLDDCLISQVEGHKLDTLIPEDLSHHWQDSLQFLKIIFHFWPKILQDQGLQEEIQSRHHRLAQLMRDWTPSSTIILAGTTGTRPTTTALAQWILTLPKGHIVLPGWDGLSLSPAALPPSHPQVPLATFLQKLGVSREEISLWHEDPEKGLHCPHRLAQDPLDQNPTGEESKGSFLNRAMSDDLSRSPWRSREERPFLRPPSGITLIPCAHEEEEALVIAGILKEVLKKPGQKGVLITPDLPLSRRVEQCLRRWNIGINVSSGRFLSETPVGQFLTLITQIEKGMSLSNWLSLLKHPLFLKSKDRFSHLQEVREWEKKTLRTFRSVSPLSSWESLGYPPWFERPFRKENLLSNGLPEGENAPCLQGLFDPFLEEGSEALLLPFSSWCQHHLTTAQSLAGEFLWEKFDGQSAQELFEDLHTDGPDVGLITWREYGDLFRRFLSQTITRDPQGIGSPLSILGTLEARQVTADVVVLGGLNEGTWPALPEEGPWLSHKMRLDLGLPSIFQKVALSAHDFCLALSAETVYLTRSCDPQGGAAMPSRLWLRVQGALQCPLGSSVQKQLSAPLLDKEDKEDSSEPLVSGVPSSPEEWIRWARSLDHPSSSLPHPCLPPRPSPCSSLKPTRYRVTDIEQLMRNPYGFYVKRILNLRKIPPLERIPGPQEWGQWVHRWMEDIMNAVPLLQKKGEEKRRSHMHALAEPLLRTLPSISLQAFWRSRWHGIVQWLEGQRLFARGVSVTHWTEVKGQWSFFLPSGQQITLQGVADRVEKQVLSSPHHSQTSLGEYQEILYIFDYKTGPLPSEKDIALGFSPQLILEGLMAEKGSFEGVPWDSSPSSSLQATYWGLYGRDNEIYSLLSFDRLRQEAEEGLGRVLSFFHSPEAIYPFCPWGEKKSKTTEDRILARVGEWKE